MRTIRKKLVKKRAFMLVELMLSLALLSACLLPAMRMHTHMQQKRAALLNEFSYQLEAKKTFGEIKEQLCTGKIHYTRREYKTGVVHHLEPSSHQRHCYFKALNEEDAPYPQMVEAILTFEDTKKTYGPYRHTFLLKKRSEAT